MRYQFASMIQFPHSEAESTFSDVTLTEFVLNHG
jgi:hypothetical protein